MFLVRSTAGAFPWFCERSERTRVLRHHFGIGLVVDELPFSFGLDQAGIGKNFQMMGNGCGRHSTQGDQLSAVHGLATVDCFINQQAGLVTKGFGDTFDQSTVHEQGIVANRGSSRQQRNLPSKSPCNRLFRHSSNCWSDKPNRDRQNGRRRTS